MNFTELESEFNDLVLKADKEFTLNEAVASLAKNLKIKKDGVEELKKETEALLEISSGLYQSDEADDLYFPKNGFYKNASFCITPSLFEIEKGILFPGHRFAPFCDEDIFQSEISLTPKNGKVVGKKFFESDFHEIVNFHTLLGFDQMYDYLIAESGDNAKVLSSRDRSGKVKLTVFDLSKFYKENSFKDGDAIIFKVKSWSEGKFSFYSVSASERNDDSKREWVRKLESALGKIFDKYGNYIEIPEQLSYAFWEDKELIANPSASLDEFIFMTDSVQISVSGDQTVLTRINEWQDDFEVPENVMISEGKTESLEEILKETGSFLKTVEVESFMLDELFNAGESFDAFFERCFGHSKLKFADDAQEAVFLNFVEDLWERRKDGYNRFNDDLKGAARSRILEVVSERVRWLGELKEKNIGEENIEGEKFKILAEHSIRLCSMLETLNNENCSISEDDMDDIMNTIEDMADIQESTIENIEKAMRL
jgi:hypothetical protein